jgi:hypothetical protein
MSPSLWLTRTSPGASSSSFTLADMGCLAARIGAGVLREESSVVGLLCRREVGDASAACADDGRFEE